MGLERPLHSYGDSESLDKYFKEIGKIDRISIQREVELAIKIKKGDQEAIDELVKANLRFVIWVAKEYQNSGLSMRDLINEGNLGIIKAAKRFDETRGFKFTSYAVWWIRQSILKALSDKSRIIRIPINKVNDLDKIQGTYRRLEQELEREPTPLEIANELKMDFNEIQNLLSVSGTHCSLDTPFQDRGKVTKDNTLLHTLRGPHTSLYESINKNNLRKEVKKNIYPMLTDQESGIIKDTFGLDGHEVLTDKKIAEKYHLTDGMMKKIRRRTIEKIKKSPHSQVLKEYWE